MNSRITVRRIIGMILGIVILSLGIALFKESGLGNDSISALNMRLSELWQIPLGTEQLITNGLFLIVEFAFGRRYIGAGTLVNGIGVGYIVSFFYDLLQKFTVLPETLPAKLIWVIAGVLVISLGVSLYQTADLGIAPYDYLAIGLKDHTPLPYLWCRILTDSVTALTAFLLGGLIGPGTIICTLGLGPFVSFFTKHVSMKLMKTGTSVSA
ncbi:MAG: YitT family protein [Solobacterium sp.]|nr:YitT family protein [Solobacterium sp.]